MRAEDKSGDLPHQVKQTPTGLWGGFEQWTWIHCANFSFDAAIESKESLWRMSQILKRGLHSACSKKNLDTIMP